MSSRAVDERLGQVGTGGGCWSGAVAQEPEGVVHVQAETLGGLALGLLDDDGHAGQIAMGEEFGSRIGCSAVSDGSLKAP
jgi:hypothetical protein